MNEVLIQMLYKYGSIVSDVTYLTFRSISEQYHLNDECTWETKGTLSTDKINEFTREAFGYNRVVSTYTLSHCTCACGMYKDETLCYDGNLSEFVEKLLAL